MTRVEVGSGLGGGMRPVFQQEIPQPQPRPASPHEVVVGTHMKGAGLRQVIETEHLTAADAKAALSPGWLPDGFETEQGEMDRLRADLQAAWEKLRGLDRELLQDRRARVTDRDGHKRPRPDGDRMKLDRQEAVVRAEIALVLTADTVLGRLRERLPDELADDQARAARLTATAQELRRQADKADAAAVQMRAVTLWKERQLQPGILKFSDAKTLTRTDDLDLSAHGIATLPRTRPTMGGI